MSVKNHISLTLTASGASQSSTLDAKSIVFISNDSANDITINFEDDVTGTGSTGSTILLKTGESIEDLEQPVGLLYYIATGGDSSFRILAKLY